MQQISLSCQRCDLEPSLSLDFVFQQVQDQWSHVWKDSEIFCWTRFTHRRSYRPTPPVRLQPQHLPHANRYIKLCWLAKLLGGECGDRYYTVYFLFYHSYEGQIHNWWIGWYPDSQQYGLAIRGLIRHHQIDPMDYDQRCDSALPLEELLKPDPALRSLLLDIDRTKARVRSSLDSYRLNVTGKSQRWSNS